MWSSTWPKIDRRSFGLERGLATLDLKSVVTSCNVATCKGSAVLRRISSRSWNMDSLFEHKEKGHGRFHFEIVWGPKTRRALLFRWMRKCPRQLNQARAQRVIPGILWRPSNFFAVVLDPTL